MEQLAIKVANKIALELSFPEEKRQVVAYGLIALFQTVLMTAIVLIAGALLNIFVEASILCFAVAILRKYAGGAHAQSIASCTIVGVAFCLGFGFAMKGFGGMDIPFPLLLGLTFFAFAFALFVAARKAPVDSINKPIRTEEKRIRMKRATFLLLFLYMVISAILLINFDRSNVFASALLSLQLSVVWQMSSLTHPGKVFLEGLDRLIYGLITFERRT